MKDTDNSTISMNISCSEQISDMFSINVILMIKKIQQYRITSSTKSSISILKIIFSRLGIS